MNVSMYALGVFLFLAPFAHAQQPLRIQKTARPPTLDGVLQEPLWSTLEPLEFTEYKPNAGIQDTLTTMYVTHDNVNLYIGFRAEEPKENAVIGRSLLRDTWYGDDYVSFHIDPNDTDDKGFVFSLFPQGSRFDMAVSNDAVPLGNATFNTAYDMIWEAEAHQGSTGWSAEFKIPLSNLRFKPDDQGRIVAGISGLRSQNHLNKATTFPKLPQEVTNAIERPSFKYPIIFEGLRPRKQLQLTPYTISSLGGAYSLEPTTEVYRRNPVHELDAGLDIRYGISSDLTLDVTLNTDFAQVEIDDQIINVNDRVNIFLPEKRRFFQEQAGLFDFNAGILSQLFYSRQIGITNGRLTPILGGVRLTGQLGKTDIGLLSLQTEGIRFDSNTPIPSENFSVVRLRRKFLNQKSFFGFMATNRVRKGYYNTALGLDNVISFPDDLFLVSSLSTTLDQESAYRPLENSRVSVFVDKRKRGGWFYRGAYEYSGEGYHPAMGFLLREKHHNLFGSLNYGRFQTDRKTHLFQYQRVGLLNSDTYFNTDLTEVLTWYNRSSWLGRFFNGDEISFFAQAQYENLASPLVLDEDLSIPIGQYSFYYFGGSFSPAVQHNIQVPINLEYGTYYDGTNLRLSIDPEFNFGRHLNIQSSYRVNRISFDARNQKEWIHIAEAKLNLAYNIHLSGSLIGQYNSLTNKLNTSARLRYNFRDGHDLYLVFNTDYNVNDGLQTPALPRFGNQILTLKYLYTLFK